MSDVCVVTGGGVCGFKRNCQKCYQCSGNVAEHGKVL